MYELLSYCLKDIYIKKKQQLTARTEKRQHRNLDSTCCPRRFWNMDTFCPDTFCLSRKRYHLYQKDSKDSTDPLLSSNPATFMLVHAHPYFLRDRCLYTELFCAKNLDF